MHQKENDKGPVDFSDWNCRRSRRSVRQGDRLAAYAAMAGSYRCLPSRFCLSGVEFSYFSYQLLVKTHIETLAIISLLSLLALLISVTPTFVM